MTQISFDKDSGQEVPYLTNRTASETDDKCPRKFWLSQKEGGKGIVPVTEALPLLVGREIHEDLSTLATIEDLSAQNLQDLIDGILSDLPADARDHQSKLEMVYRRAGWIAAWGLFIEPTIRAHWTNVSIEKEIILDRSPLWVAVTPDRVVQNKAHPDRLKYIEYKSTITAKKQWLDSWMYQIQLHTSLAAVNEELKKKVGYATVVGLLKGSYSPADNRLLHPYVWGYYNSQSGAWTHDYNKSRSSNWEPMPVWEYPGGVVEWVQKCGEEVARAQFPTSPPVTLNKRMLNEWVTRRLAREKQIRVVQDLCQTDLKARSVFFPMIQSQCRPAFGDPCPYIRPCWTAGFDPKNDPDFEVRKPHHDLEVIELV